jgi:hypothetical protein
LAKITAKRVATRVVRQLPETGNMLQYRIKSEMGGHERVVRED